MARLVSLLLACAVAVAACTDGKPPTLAHLPDASPGATPEVTAQVTPAPAPTPKPLHPLSIEYMRQQEYPGSDITIEQTLAPGSNYNRYIASYRSQGLKIDALLTVPRGAKPASGWPVVIFNHGYIPPAEYRTTERYVAYVDAFARNGYLVFKSDYRGHGSSEGQASGGYGSPDYTIDILNALSSLKRSPDADPNRIGMWGHSMGGHITLRSLVTVNDLKAGVIWAGVVASYPDLLTKWTRRGPAGPPASSPPGGGWRQTLISQYGAPEENPDFWNSISPNSFLGDLSAPVQLHHGSADESVPISFSETLNAQLKEAGKTVEFYVYPGDEHNLSHNLYLALQRSVAFFDRYVKRT